MPLLTDALFDNRLPTPWLTSSPCSPTILYKYICFIAFKNVLAYGGGGNVDEENMNISNQTYVPINLDNGGTPAFRCSEYLTIC